MKRILVLATSLVLAMGLIAPSSALAGSDSDIVLDEGALSGWTAPEDVGRGPLPVGEGEDAEQVEVPEVIDSQSAELAATADVIISGSGWSHGVGMSQYGAYAQALAGRSYQQILASYYPGATLTTGAASEALWVNLEQELIKVILTAKQITTSPTPVSVTRGPESVALANGDSVTIEYTGLVDGVRECTFSSGTFVSEIGPCNLDLEWDGWVTSPTMRVVIDKVWYWDSPAAGEECTHSISPLTLECAYSRGTIHIRPDDNDESPPGDIGFHVVVEVDRDKYALGIGESPYSWPSEALKSQAVAARGFASWVTDTRAAVEDRQWCWCNIYDKSPDQVYLGWGFGTSKWVNAVRDTDRELLTYRGSPAATFYGSSTGGTTENNEDIWHGTPIPYLRSNPDVWSLSPLNPQRTWDVGVSSSNFASTLGFSSVSSVEVVDRFESGTPSDVVVAGIVSGTTTTKHFTGVEIQSRFRLKSPHLNQIRGTFDSGDPVVDRRGGANRYETAVALSWKNFANGSGPTVVIARGDLFPDALAAAPLAAGLSGPVLLTPPTVLPEIVAQELNRLNPSRIYIVGGSGAVSDSVAAKLATYAPVERLAGASRYETAVEISKEVAPSGSGTVFIASGLDYPDAASGSAVAAALDGPLLLTLPSGIPVATRNELTRLKPSEIVVVGGSSVVGPTAIAQLEGYASKVTVLAGANRFDTSAELSQWAYPSGADHVYLATGSAFPDALAGAAIAGSLDAPILLVTQSSIPASVQSEIQRLGASHITLLGGPGAISYAVQDSVDDL